MLDHKTYPLGFPLVWFLWGTGKDVVFRAIGGLPHGGLVIQLTKLVLCLASTLLWTRKHCLVVKARVAQLASLLVQGKPAVWGGLGCGAPGACQAKQVGLQPPFRDKRLCPPPLGDTFACLQSWVSWLWRGQPERHLLIAGSIVVSKAEWYGTFGNIWRKDQSLWI